MTWNNNDNNAGGGSTPPPPPPPPPPGGFGSTPPPPPPGGGNFGGPSQPAGQPGSLDATLALKQSWELFKKNWLVLIVPLLIVGMLSWLVTETLGTVKPVPAEFVGNSAMESLYRQKQLPFVAEVLLGAFRIAGSIVLFNGFLRATRGEKLDSKVLFSGFNWGIAFAVFFVAGIASSLGVIGCIIGVFATMAIFQFAYPAVLNGASFGESFSETWNLGTKNFGGALAVVGLQIVVCIAGLLACCVGLVVAIPVAYGMIVCAYRQLRGEPIQIEQPGM